MLGGIYVNYYEVKKGKFKFNYRDSTVNFEVPTVNKSETLIKILENFCETIALDINKVRQLIPLIFWNMAPLHKEPFSNLCWALGISHFEALSQ
jgi:hypothetical protein